MKHGELVKEFALRYRASILDEVYNLLNHHRRFDRDRDEWILTLLSEMAKQP